MNGARARDRQSAWKRAMLIACEIILILVTIGTIAVMLVPVKVGVSEEGMRRAASRVPGDQ